MIGILLTVLVAALVYLLLAALTGSAIVAIIGRRSSRDSTYTTSAPTSASSRALPVGR